MGHPTTQQNLDLKDPNEEVARLREHLGVITNDGQLIPLTKEEIEHRLNLVEEFVGVNYLKYKLTVEDARAIRDLLDVGIPLTEIYQVFSKKGD